MSLHGVYAGTDTTPVGYRRIISVYEPLIGDGPGQKSLFEWIQLVVPLGVPFGIFEYPSKQYPLEFDLDAWYPTPEETTAGFGIQQVSVS